MHPAFSVIFLTTLIGAGQGLFISERAWRVDGWQPGDRVEVEVEGVGVLENPVR